MFVFSDRGVNTRLRYFCVFPTGFFTLLVLHPSVSHLEPMVSKEIFRVFGQISFHGPNRILGSRADVEKVAA